MTTATQTVSFAAQVADEIARASEARERKLELLAALVETTAEDHAQNERWLEVCGPFGRFVAGSAEEQYQKLTGYSINIGGRERSVQLENLERFNHIVELAAQLQRELALRPLPRHIPLALDPEAGGVPPGRDS